MCERKRAADGHAGEKEPQAVRFMNNETLLNNRNL